MGGYVAVMTIATITKDGIKGSLEFELPSPRPQAKNIYVFKEHAQTVAGTLYNPGDTLELIEMTKESPHGYRCSAGNWKIRSKMGVTVWSMFEKLLVDGYFK